MNRREDGRLHPDRLGGPGAAVGDTLVWDGMRWVPAEVESAPPVHVDTTAPSSPATGQLWYDTDDTC